VKLLKEGVVNKVQLLKGGVVEKRLRTTCNLHYGNQSWFPVALLNAQRGCLPLFYIEPFTVMIFSLHVEVYWRVCCICEYNQ